MQPVAPACQLPFYFDEGEAPWCVLNSFMATEASMDTAFAILLPPGEWPLVLEGGGRGRLGPRWSWGYSQALPWLEDDPAQPSWFLLPSQVLALSFEMSGQRDKVI